MGYAEQVSVDKGEGQAPSSAYQALRGGPGGAGVSVNEAMRGDGGDERAGANMTNLDAIIAAARAGDVATPLSQSQTKAMMAEVSGQSNNQSVLSQGAQEGPTQTAKPPPQGARHLTVDEENPLRPRYTGWSPLLGFAGLSRCSEGHSWHSYHWRTITLFLCSPLVSKH